MHACNIIGQKQEVSGTRFSASFFYVRSGVKKAYFVLTGGGA